jgi:hypothetical protein
VRLIAGRRTAKRGPLSRGEPAWSGRCPDWVRSSRSFEPSRKPDRWRSSASKRASFPLSTWLKSRCSGA